MPLAEITNARVYLAQGATYYAKLQLTGSEATFGSASDVRDALTKAGFNQVSVWTSAPAIFPDRAAYADGDTYWASGIYTRASGEQVLPPEIKRTWVMEAADDPANPDEPVPSPEDPNPTPETPATPSGTSTANASATSTLPAWKIAVIAATAIGLALAVVEVHEHGGARRLLRGRA